MPLRLHIRATLLLRARLMRQQMKTCPLGELQFGYYSLMAASMGCRVIAWEPVPYFAAFFKYALLRNNLTHAVQASWLLPQLLEASAPASEHSSSPCQRHTDCPPPCPARCSCGRRLWVIRAGAT